MASHKKKRTNSPADAPENHDKSEGQSLTHYATTVGIVTGLFGMLFGVGFNLLPAATMREKVLVIGASLAVAVAGLTGVGAWRSPRRFGLTMFAGGLALICLADLSIAAASGTQPTVQAAGSVKSPPRPSASDTTSSISGSHGSHSSAHSKKTKKIYMAPRKASPATVHEVFLSKLAWEPGSDRDWIAPEPGPQIMSKTEFNDSLAYRNLCSHTTPVLYSLGKTYRRFLVTAGIADGSSTKDDVAEAAFEVEGKAGAGSFRLLDSATAVPGGDPSWLDVPIPSGTTELQLTTTVMDGACMQDSTIVWGNPRVMS